MVTSSAHFVRPYLVHAMLLAAAMAATPAARADDGGCARSMVRQTFDHLTPPPKYRDPRGQLPAEMTVEQRRALHPVLWPSGFSARSSVSHWLGQRNFDCLEEAFADLDATQARFPDGSFKSVSFLGGASSHVAQRRGMTEAEIAGLIGAWRKRHPESLLAEVMWPRMLMNAAWAVRGGDVAANVAPERVSEFHRLNELAMKQALAWSPAVQEHVLGHYVALSAITANGATRDQIARFALDALQRFPAESELALIAGQRMLPKWGGSDAEFESFASTAMEVVGPSRAKRMYAALYARAVGLEELHKHPLARGSVVKAGLMELASLGTSEGIETLQEFACTKRDAEALRQAQAAWAQYASQPQLRGARTELDAGCREWERTLPPVATAESSRPTPASRPARARPKAWLSADLSLYGVASGGPWERSQAPVGDLFTCTACDAAVQILLAAEPPLDPALQPATNEGFLRALSSSDARERIARAHTGKAMQLDAAELDLKVEKTDFVRIDGVTAFRYESTIRFEHVTVRETVMELIHKGRLLRILISRSDGPVGSKEREAVLAFMAGLELASP